MSIRSRLVPFAIVLVAVATTPVLAAGPRAHSSLAQLAGKSGCVADSLGEGSQAGCNLAKALISARAVALSPDGANAYVAAGDALVSLKRDASSGALSELGCVSNNGTRGAIGTDGDCVDGDALLNANSVAVAPDGSQVYVAAGGSSALNVFTRDAQTGALQQASCIQDFVKEGHCVDSDAVEGARSVVVSPDGRSIYVLGGVSGTRSQATGSVTNFAHAADGSVKESDCISDDGSNGACSDGTALIQPSAGVVSADGANLYVAAEQSLLSFSRDADTGKLAQIGCVLSSAPKGPCTNNPLEFTGSPTALAISPDGKSLYTANYSGIQAFTRGSDGKAAPGACYIVKEEPEVVDDEEAIDEEPTDDEAAARAAAQDCTQVPSLWGLTGLAVSPDGKTLYATSTYAGALIALKRDDSGELTFSSCVTSDSEGAAGCDKAEQLIGANGVTVSRDGDFIYVTSGIGAVAAFRPGAASASRSAAVKGSTADVAVTCSPARHGACRGMLRLVRSGSRRGGAASAAQAFKVGPGASRQVRMRLGESLLRSLQRHGSVRVSAVVRERDGRTRAVSRALVLRLRR